MLALLALLALLVLLALLPLLPLLAFWLAGLLSARPYVLSAIYVYGSGTWTSVVAKELSFLDFRALINPNTCEPQGLYPHRFKIQSATNSQECTHKASHEFSLVYSKGSEKAWWRWCVWVESYG